MKFKISSLFLPVENYTIRTKLSEEEIIGNLKEITHNSGRRSKSSLFGLGTAFVQKSGSRYEGTIESGSFKISRVISYRNSFLPVIKGSVSSFMNQREITISMRLNLFVKLFMSLWLIITCSISAFVLYQVYSGEKTMDGKLVPFIMAGSGYLGMMLGFKMESMRSKKELNQLFEAETGTPL
ncbi:hypothetical protein D3C87_181540 [compost metagenome]